MRQVIVITGASSGFGALTARALARSGHTGYAGMRATHSVPPKTFFNVQVLRQGVNTTVKVTA
jgi:NAD(P)-dependent dehydrogenase (short-subunit alcohol dehydrogenase family)